MNDTAYPALESLRGTFGKSWEQIGAAARLAETKLQDISKAVGTDTIPGGDAGLIVFGSLARGEMTSGSDLDWTLLIDGRADSSHLAIAQEIERRLADAEIKKPGPTGVFGGLAFSHEIIHQIGGGEDTNRNMTRRILLLLESAPIPVGESKLVRERVLRGVLSRYIEEDPSFIDPGEMSHKPPRFLLNDVVRFWRTMAVDYASKYRERAAKGWALRNIKLRMSRKLIFVSGLLMCLDCKLNPLTSYTTLFSDAPNLRPLIDHIERFVGRPPLEILAEAVQRYAPDTAVELFDSYDEFLGVLNDPVMRDHLDKLPPSESKNDLGFAHVRAVTDRFDAALSRFFFDSNEELAALVKKYGVF